MSALPPALFLCAVGDVASVAPAAGFAFLHRLLFRLLWQMPDEWKLGKEKISFGSQFEGAWWQE